MAWRTVLRDTSKVRQSSASEGSSAPVGRVPADMFRFMMLTSWEYRGMSLSMDSLLISTGFVFIVSLLGLKGAGKAQKQLVITFGISLSL